MSLVILAMAAMCLWGMKIGIKEPLGDFISKESTEAAKGIFVLIVFISHSKGYVTYSGGIWDDLAVKVCEALNQLMVVPFFLYSGYGIGTSLITKENYGKTFMAKRFLPVLLKFDFVVLLYLAASLVTGVRYSLYETLKSFAGWESVGNSNWFICVTLILYVAVYVSSLISKGSVKKTAALIGVITVLYIVAAKIIGRPEPWYDTVIAFPVGVFLAVYRDAFDRATEKIAGWVLSLGASTALFLVCWYALKFAGESSALRVVLLSFKTLFFGLALVIVTRRFSPRNKVLAFFGRHVFGIYILQRLPMMLLTFFFPTVHPWLFASVSFAATVILSLLFDRFIRPEAILFGRKGKKKNP